MSDPSVRIKNNRLAEIVLPVVLSIPKKPGERAKRLHPARSLIPGVNVVPAAYYEAVKENPQVKSLFEDKGDTGTPMLQLVGAGDSSFSSSAETQAIENRPPEEAYVMINNSDDVAQLERWAAKETRREVTNAIIARLEILEREGKEAESR